MKLLFTYIQRPKINFITIKYITIIFFISRFFNLSLSGKVYSRISIFVSLCVVVNYFLKEVFVPHQARIKIDWITLGVLLFTLVQLLINFVCGVSIYAVISSMYPIVATTCFVSMAIKKSPRELIKAYTIYVSVILIITFIEMICFADINFEWGRITTSFFFIGGINQFGIFFAVILGIQFLYKEMQDNLFSNILIIVTTLMIVFMSYVVKSSTTYICVAMNILLLFLPGIWKILAKMRGIFLLAVYMTIWVFLTIVQELDIFKNIIVNVFHRNMTLTNRTEIWKIALKSMEGKWFLGYGKQISGDVIFYKDTLWSLHNEVFQLIYEGGIVLLLSFGFFFLLCMKKNKIRKNNLRISAIIVTSIVVALLNWLTEAPGLYTVIFFLVIYAKSQYLTTLKTPHNQQIYKSL